MAREKDMANLIWIATERSDIGLYPCNGHALIEYPIVAVDLIRSRSGSIEAKNAFRSTFRN